MMNVRPKLFKNELPAHHPLRFTQVCSIDKIIIIWENIYFIAKTNSADFFEAFDYRKKLLLGSSVITLWLA